MEYKDNQPTFNAGDRKMVNFKDFTQELPSEKQELKKMKRSFRKNVLEVGQKQRKLKYNKVTKKLDDVGQSDIEDRLDQFKESVEDSDIIELVKTKISQQRQAQYDTETQLDELIFIANRLGLYDAADFIKENMRRSRHYNR